MRFSEPTSTEIRPLEPRPPERIPTHLPEPRLRPAPAMPDTPKSVIDRLASVTLFKVPGWLVFVSTVLAFIGAHLLGISGLDVAEWAGADRLMTLGELLGGLVAVVGGAVAAQASTNVTGGTETK